MFVDFGARLLLSCEFDGLGFDFCCGCDVSLFVAGDFDSLGFLRGLCCVVWCWSYMAGLMLS